MAADSEDRADGRGRLVGRALAFCFLPLILANRLGKEWQPSLDESADVRETGYSNTGRLRLVSEYQCCELQAIDRRHDRRADGRATLVLYACRYHENDLSDRLYLDIWRDRNC